MPKNKFDFDFDFDWGSLANLPVEGVDNWDLMPDLSSDWDVVPDPYANWGGGQGGDGTDGSGDFGSGSNGSSGSWLSQIGRLFGLGNSLANPTGAGGTLGSLGSLLPLLALGGGALFQNRNTGQATEQMLAANQRAEDLVTGRMNAPSPFKPYTDQGREGVWNMQAMGPRALAGNYKPLGSGKALGKLGGR